LRVSSGTAQGKVQVSVCVGTSCYVRGAQDLLHKLSRHIEQNGLEEQVSVQASFCFERCDRGPTVTIDGQVLEKCDLAKACAVLTDVLQKRTNA
jgi:NADH-quinone oxidoreductase subunit G